jgi:hypothetical protein
MPHGNGLLRGSIWTTPRPYRPRSPVEPSSTLRAPLGYPGLPGGRTKVRQGVSRHRGGLSRRKTPARDPSEVYIAQTRRFVTPGREKGRTPGGGESRRDSPPGQGCVRPEQSVPRLLHSWQRGRDCYSDLSPTTRSLPSRRASGSSARAQVKYGSCGGRGPGAAAWPPAPPRLSPPAPARAGARSQPAAHRLQGLNGPADRVGEVPRRHSPQSRASELPQRGRADRTLVGIAALSRPDQRRQTNSTHARSPRPALLRRPVWESDR